MLLQKIDEKQEQSYVRAGVRREAQLAFEVNMTTHFNNVVAWMYVRQALHTSTADAGVLRCGTAPRDESEEEAQAFCEVCHLGPYYSHKGDRSLDNPLLKCVSCGIFVHFKCVNFDKKSNDSFQCDRCQFLARSNCPHRG